MRDGWLCISKISSHKSECEMVWGGSIKQSAVVSKLRSFGTFVNLWSGFSPPADSQFSVHGTDLSAVDKRSLLVMQLSGFFIINAFTSLARFVAPSRLRYGPKRKSDSTVQLDASSQWNKRRSRTIRGMKDKCNFDASSSNADQNDGITLIQIHHQDIPLQIWLTSETIIRI